MSAVPAPQRPHVPLESWPDALEAAVASACTLLRTVIVLRHLEGLTFPQVADRMGKTVDSVEKIWLRALGSLRTALREAP